MLARALKVVALTLAFCTLSPPDAVAHQFRPTLLRADLHDDGAHRLTWKWDAMDPRAIDPADIVFPAECEIRRTDSNAGPERIAWFALECRGTPLTVALPRAPMELVLDLRTNGEPTRIERLSPPPTQIALSEMAASGGSSGSTGPVAMGSWIVLGVEHILFGWDHLAFVIALAFLVAAPRRVALVVTGFTVGHSVTLIGATLDWMPSPGSGPVEAVISLSIVYLAVELMRDAEARTRFARRLGFGVAILFGLIHGFGFAGALSSFSLPDGAEVPALLAFNIGVELGQIAIVTVALGIRAVAVKFAAAEREPIISAAFRTATAYAAGSIAVAWTIERAGGILLGRG